MSLDVWLTCPCCENEVWSYNITHNLNEMADEAGLYRCLWRPEELLWFTANELIPTLTAGLELLKKEPDRFKQFDPENGWGSYEGLIQFVESYLKACKQHPNAKIWVSR